MFLFSLILVVLVTWGCLYQFFGLKEYIRATKYVNNLGEDVRGNARERLDLDSSTGHFGGILAGVWKGPFPGVFLWTRQTLKYFRVDQFSVYTYHNACVDELINPANPRPKTTVKVKRTIFTDLNLWSKNLKTGYFLDVMVTGKSNGGTLGNLREVWATDWWPFMNEDLATQCVK